MPALLDLPPDQREHLLRTIIDTEPECVKVLGPDGTLRLMNPAGLRMIQADSPDQVIGLAIAQLVAPEHRDAFNELTSRVLEGGRGSLEFRANGLKGASLWLETHAVPLRGVGGGVDGLLGITRDITDRKRADEALRASEANFRMLFEQAGDGILVSDAAGALLDANRAACAMTGYSHHELIGRTVRDIVSPRELPRIDPEIARLSTGEIITSEWTLARRDGTEIVVEVRAKQLPDGRLQAFCRDISDRKQAEAAQARMAQAHRMETVGRLAGGIAHDFNNLLTVINATADVILSELRERDAHYGHLQQIQQAGDRAATLTRQLLALSRQQIVKPEVLRLNAVLTAMEDMLRRLLGEDVELRLALDASDGNVKMDAGQLEQIVLNLVLNARDAMPDGGTLAIRTTRHASAAAELVEFTPSRSGPYVVLQVEDGGTGMDDATRRRVFEPFFTTKEQGRGTGLGLSMVYGAVKHMGGTLRLDSTPGVGTTVALYLPEIETTPAPAPAPRQAAPAAQRGQETILIVEDEPALRGLARRILEHAGYTVLEASNGDEALDVLGRHTGAIDLVFTDVVMPRMNGRVLASHIERLRPAVKILFASGYTDDVVLRRGVMEDPLHFLPKPYTATVLRSKVRAVLDAPADRAVLRSN